MHFVHFFLCFIRRVSFYVINISLTHGFFFCHSKWKRTILNYICIICFFFVCGFEMVLILINGKLILSFKFWSRDSEFVLEIIHLYIFIFWLDWFHCVLACYNINLDGNKFLLSSPPPFFYLRIFSCLIELFSCK